MTVTERLAESLKELGGTPLSEALRDKVTRHIFDTIGAILAGLRLAETTALAEASAELHGGPVSGLHGPLAPTILQLCAAVRATEVDDIHLAACVTPSSIIVPTALATAARLPGVTGDQLVAACVTGYEALIRLGLAVNGPGILYKGIWPTYLCAGIGSAATVAALLDLPKPQMAQALAIAAAMAAGANARSDSPCAKWLMAGTAAQSGALAAFAARRGFLGDLDLLGERWGKLFSVALDSERLTAPAGDEPKAAQLAMKAWCGARQTMAALAGFTALLKDHALNVTSLREILVEVPAAYLQMIDRPGLPKSRQESFANLRYLLGLAAFAPEGLYDVARDALRIDSRFEALAKRIRVEPREELARHYPRHWPAKVSVTDHPGKTYTREVLHAPGDAEAPLGWDALAEKFRRVTGVPQSTIDPIAKACRDLSSPSGVTTLLALVEDMMRAVGSHPARS